jgi:very-short-patch-repair endonuclease
MDALELVTQAGVKVRRQVNLGSYTEWIGRTDAKVVDLPLIIEVDSIVHHMSPMDQARDAARDAEFREAGLEVVRIFDVEVYRRPWTVGPKVLEACACVRRGEPVPKRGVPTLLFSPNSFGVGQEPLPGRTRYAS